MSRPDMYGVQLTITVPALIVQDVVSYFALLTLDETDLMEEEMAKAVLLGLEMMIDCVSQDAIADVFEGKSAVDKLRAILDRRTLAKLEAANKVGGLNGRWPDQRPAEEGHS